MSVFVLTAGVLFKPAEQKTSSKTGKLFTTCTVKVGSETGASDFWNVLIFSESAQLEMLRLEVGDAVAVRGKLELKTYTAGDGTTKISRSIFCDHVMALRQPPKERKPKAPPTGSKAADQIVKQSIVPPSSESSTDKPASSFYDDEIPF
jgi:single-stranded DNA-binding protein